MLGPHRRCRPSGWKKYLILHSLNFLYTALLSSHCCLYNVVKCVGYYTIHHIVFTHAKLCVVYNSNKLLRLGLLENNYGRSIDSKSLKIRITVFCFIPIQVGENS